MVTLGVRRRLVVLVLGVMVAASLVAAQAANAANTVIGPGPVVTSSDYETCGNTWATTTETPKFIVSPQNFDGSYNVTLQLAIKFTSIAGQSPGACPPDFSGGSTIPGNVKGSGSGQIKFSVSGGLFDETQTCDTNCYTQATQYNMGPFTTAFFGPNATWKQAVTGILSTYRFQSTNTLLFHKAYTSSWLNGGFDTAPLSASGDISTN